MTPPLILLILNVGPGGDADFSCFLLWSLLDGWQEPLFRERDRYMAWAVKRSKAVTNAESVVGVIGRGHLTPVLEEIHRDYEAAHLSFDKVARLP